MTSLSVNPSLRSLKRAGMIFPGCERGMHWSWSKKGMFLGARNKLLGPHQGFYVMVPDNSPRSSCINKGWLPLLGTHLLYNFV